MSSQITFTDIASYIATLSQEMQVILQAIRAEIKAELPEAVEAIHYNMPAMKVDGAYVYFAAFKKHIGVYPPVHQDATLKAEVQRYRGEKGNLKFPLDEPMPYLLIRRVARAIVEEHRKRTA